MTPNDFNGLPIHILENNFLRLETLKTSARIVRLTPTGKSNLFANLGDNSQDTPYGPFFFHGGHRLWHAPEALPRTYIPDNDGAVLSEIPGGVRIDQPTETWTNIAKSLEIRLNPDQPQVILRHELRNDGPWAIELAPWALTMLRQGGVGIFPQPQGNVDNAGLLANRNLSIWPYNLSSDKRLVLRDDCILLHAQPSLPPIKIGYFNPHGWAAYWIEGTLFVKRFDAPVDAAYPDNGCNTETYCNHKFIELETLGALVKLAPGATVVHNETWEIYESLDQPFIPDEIKDLLTL
ncbi:MAG: hypothetical protein WCK35_12750 [Chloroflexota bacterium]